MDPQEAWQIASHQLELQLDRGSFDTWLRGAVFLRHENGVFVIGVRNTYIRDMLQHRLYRNIWRVLSDVVGESVELRFEIHQPPRQSASDFNEMPLFQLLARQQAVQAADDAAAHETVQPVSSGLSSSDPGANGGTSVPLHSRVSRPERAALPDSELNPRYTFERYVVGNGGRMAYEAARAVAENPGRNYNPFMVYGGVGLGKTHLLQAIAHRCQAQGLRAIYVPSEAFTNDLIDAIRQRTTAMFREKYRSVDVLLLDDVQFIGGKESTQEEFFHTFNALYTFNKQIVLASDRHPQELVTLEDRLRSRFSGGLVVDIPPLDFETRLAIVSMWAEERGVQVPRSVLEMVAEHGSSNVRALEGMFNQVLAKAHFTRQPLTIDAAARALQQFEAPREHSRAATRQPQRVVRISDILRVTAQYYQMKVAELTGKNRAQRVNEARQVAMYLARELTDLSLPQIGEAFGGRSHTTVLHGANKVVEALNLNDPIAHDIREIRRILLED